MIDKLTTLNQKIDLLKKKKEKIQNHQALLFMKEVQRIFTEEFTPDLALTILSEAWNKGSETQKEQWKKRGHSFRLLSIQNNKKKNQTIDPAHHQS